ncbi:MAG: STAS domain-containing protein [Burkholderiales bacterium]|nr:STAS domain-containing protein [Burkholderiales bacterium]
MQLNLSHETQALVIQPDAEHLDASNVKAFREAIAPLFQSHPRMVLDMSGLDFLDSAGVGALIACLRTAKEREGDFRLCGLSRPVRTLFDLMRMHRVFDIHTDRAETLRSFAS